MNIDETFKSFCVNVLRRCCLIVVKWVEETYNLTPQRQKRPPLGVPPFPANA